MSKSEEKVKIDKTKTGFGFRLTQAILYTLGFVEVFCVLYFTGGLKVVFEGGTDTGLIITLVVMASCLLLAIICWLLTFLGRKFKWANIVCIVLDAPLCITGLSLCGLIGGIQGLKFLSDKEKVVEAKIAEDTEVAQTAPISGTESIPLDGRQAEEAESSVQPKAQGVQAPVKQPNKKVGWALFGVMAAYYLFLLVFGILSMVMPEKGLAWGPYDSILYTVSMNKITGFILILLVPSFGYFLACRAPFRMGKKGSIIVFACSLVLTIVGDVLFYILMKDYFYFVNVTMKLAPVLAELGLIAIYLVGFLKLSPQKLTKTTYKKTGDTWKDLLGGLINTLLNGLKFLMLHRNSVGFVIGGTVVFSLCLFVMMELLYAVLAVVVILLLAVLFSSLYVRSNVYSNEYLVTDDSGSTRTLHYDRYNNFYGEDIYKDDNGGEWATKDGGKSFYPVTSDNARREDRSEEGLFKNY